MREISPIGRAASNPSESRIIAVRRDAPYSTEDVQRYHRLLVDKPKDGILDYMSKPALNVDDLSPEERLRLIEKLWDSLSDKPGAVPLTDAQRAELDRRLDELERTGPAGIRWEEVLQQIRTRPK